MTAIIVTQDGVEVAYDQQPPLSVTTSGVEVAYEEALTPGVETFTADWAE